MAYGVNRYKTKLEVSDFTTSNANVDNIDFRPIFKFKVPAKQKVAPGAGMIVNGVDIRETFKITIKNSSGTDIPGKVRWVVKDANEANSLFGDEYKYSDANTGVKLGIRPDRVIGEDAYLIIEYKADSSATIDFSKCSVEFPVTKELINNLQ